MYVSVRMSSVFTCLSTCLGMTHMWNDAENLKYDHERFCWNICFTLTCVSFSMLVPLSFVLNFGRSKITWTLNHFGFWEYEMALWVTFLTNTDETSTFWTHLLVVTINFPLLSIDVWKISVKYTVSFLNNSVQNERKIFITFITRYPASCLKTCGD